MNHFLSLWPCDMHRDNVCYHMLFPLRNRMSTDQTIYSFLAKLIFMKCRVYWVIGHAYHKQSILLTFLTKQCTLSHYNFYFIELKCVLLYVWKTNFIVYLFFIILGSFSTVFRNVFTDPVWVFVHSVGQLASKTPKLSKRKQKWKGKIRIMLK